MNHVSTYVLNAVPSYPLSNGGMCVQPGSVQSPNQEDVVASMPERERILITVEVEASPCAIYELERFLSHPGRALWLRHWMGEAIGYVVKQDRGRAWSYVVKNGKVSRGRGDGAC